MQQGFKNTGKTPEYVLIGTTYIGILEKDGTLFLKIEYESLATNDHSEELSHDKAKELLTLLKTTLDK